MLRLVAVIIRFSIARAQMSVRQVSWSWGGQSPAGKSVIRAPWRAIIRDSSGT